MLLKRKEGKSNRRTRLLVEQLECRTVPATFSWIGQTSAFWGEPTNWIADGAPTTSLPGPGDHVEIADTLIAPIISYDIPPPVIGKLTSIGTGAELYIYNNVLTIDACQCGPSVWNGDISCESFLLGRTNGSMIIKGLADFRWTGGLIDLIGMEIIGGATFSAEQDANVFHTNLVVIGREEGLEVGNFAIGSIEQARSLNGHISVIETRFDVQNFGRFYFLDSHNLDTSGGIAWTPTGPPYSLIHVHDGGSLKVLGWDMGFNSTRCDVPIIVEEGGEMILFDHTRLTAGTTDPGFALLHGVLNLGGAVEVGSGSVLTVRGLGYKQDYTTASFTVSSGLGGIVGNVAIFAGLVDIGVFAMGSEYSTLIVDGNMSIGSAATIRLHVHGSGGYEHDTLVVTQTLVLGQPKLHVITVGEFVMPPVVVDDHLYQVIQAIGGFTGGIDQEGSTWDPKIYEIDTWSDPSSQLIWLNQP